MTALITMSAYINLSKVEFVVVQRDGKLSDN